MPDMHAAALIRSTRCRAGLSQRELARRARTSAAAVCQYERGERVPRVDTLVRLLAVAGGELVLDVRPTPRVDVEANGRDLEAVLELADALPQRHDPELRYPPFHTQARR
jgi:transcriptional regulator with XRE-family HTH domain